jgi:predicted RNA-binding protein YlxR (DUF448 family)
MLARIDEENATDGGPKGAATERFCVVTREVKPVSELIRFVVAPDGAVVPDLKRKLPGRGLWLSGNRDALGQAIRRNLFARGFKSEVRAGTDLIATTELLLERAALDALAIAGKAGVVLSGFTRVETAMGREKLVAIFHARDGAADGVRKLDAAMRRNTAESADQIERIDTFTSSQLDLALGRPNVVHAALLAGDASKGFLARYARLQRFRTGKAGNPGHDKARHQDARGLGSE